MGEASGSPGRAKQPLVAALGRGGIENYDAQNRSAKNRSTKPLQFFRQYDPENHATVQLLPTKPGWAKGL